MAIKLCHHIKEDGIWCKSAALHGRDYCYFHSTFRGRRIRIIQQQARQQSWRLELPPLEALNAVQVSIMQVLDALADDRIGRHRGGLIPLRPAAGRQQPARQRPRLVRGGSQRRESLSLL